MMYNTDFKVKYHDIKEELIWKLKNKTPEELETNPDPEYEYSNTDILLICDKLYQDELVSVFYASNMIDDKIDIGIKYISEQMILNNDFKQIVDEMKRILIVNNIFITTQEQDYFTKNSDHMIMLTLFNESTFYIFHKCICQQLTLGTIDTILLDELKKNTVDIINT